MITYVNFLISILSHNSFFSCISSLSKIDQSNCIKLCNYRYLPATQHDCSLSWTLSPFKSGYTCSPRTSSSRWWCSWSRGSAPTNGTTLIPVTQAPKWSRINSRWPTAFGSPLAPWCSKVAIWIPRYVIESLVILWCKFFPSSGRMNDGVIRE